MSRMAAPVSLDVHGRQVIVTHPGRVVFPAHNDRKGYTKFDLVRYYLAVAEGAMRGVAGRPMILKRFVKGISAEAVFQKRAPANRPDWVDVAELHYASGRSAAEAVIHDAAGLAWVINLGGQQVPAPDAGGNARDTLTLCDRDAAAGDSCRSPRLQQPPGCSRAVHRPNPRRALLAARR